MQHGVLWELNIVLGPSFLTEEDIPCSSLNGRDPSQLKNAELQFWLKCRGDRQRKLNNANGIRNSFPYFFSECTSI